MNTPRCLALQILLLGLAGCSATVITNVSQSTGGVPSSPGGSQTSGGADSSILSSQGGSAVATSATISNAGGGASGNATLASGGAIMSGGAASSTTVVAVGGSAGGNATSAAGGATTNGGASSSTLVATGGTLSVNTVSSGGNAGFATGGNLAVGGSTNALTSLVATGGDSQVGGASAFGGATGGVATTFTGVEIGGNTAVGGADTAGNGTGGANTGGASTTTSTTASELLSECKLLLHMDEVTWNGTNGEVKDASGLGNNGTSIAGATTGSPAVFGNAGQFGGAGYVIVNNSDSLHANGAFTVSAWIYPTFLDGSRAPGIVSKRTGYGVNTEFAVFLWTENRLFVDIMGETDRFSSNTQFSTGQWYHVAVVFDGSLATATRVWVYVNGQLDRVAPESSSVVTAYDSQLEIGDLPVGGQTFVGSIDEVAMWQRALRADEVLSIYQRTSPL